MEIKNCENEEQLQELATLANEIWHEYFVSLISKEQINYMVEKYQSYGAMKHAIENDHYTYFLAYEDDRLIGYCGVKLETEKLFLSKLYLHKSKRGLGYASILLKKAIEFGKEHGKNAIYLTCNKYNKHSLDVYAKKGFYEIDSVVTDIGNGFVMDDYILQLDI